MARLASAQNNSAADSKVVKASQSEPHLFKGPYCLALVPLVLLLTFLMARPLSAQAIAPDVSLGNVNVGYSATGTVTFTFQGATSIANISVLTHGSTQLDFTPGVASATACSPGTYTNGQTCTVAVRFAPLSTGLRRGTATLTSGDGTVIAIGNVTGYGTASKSVGGTAASGTQSAADVGSTGSQSSSAASGYVWLLDVNGTTSKLTPSGTTVMFDVGTVNNASAYGGIAADGSGNIWSVTPTSNTLSFVNSGGAAIASYSGGGLNGPAALAVDDQGNLWVANSAGNSLSEFSSSGAAISPKYTGFTGYRSTSYGAPSGVAIDTSGNVWVANASTNTVTEILGAAAPVVPAATAITSDNTGARP